MPELPEVETTVFDLKKRVLKRTFVDVWTNFEKMIKRPKSFREFKQALIGKKILNIRRRGKNILFDLSQKKILLIHLKLTGHLLFGKWKFREGEWRSLIPGPLSEDPMNKFLHLIFFFNDKKQLALSDARKFAKAELWEKNELENSKEFKSLGLEPLGKNFNFEKFKEVFKKKKKSKIKQALMDQTVIAGIGNIYSDEVLWVAKINPFREVGELMGNELMRIHTAIRKVLKQGIKLNGASVTYFRRLNGNRGKFDVWKKVYRRENQKCFRCGGKIEKKKIGGRSAHFCPKCQKL